MKSALFDSRHIPEPRPTEARRQGQEPSTGLVRKVNAVRAALSSAPPRASRLSGVQLGQRDWRCLEPERPEQRPRRDASVSIAQVSLSGECLRHSGPDKWLPEAAEFVHRAALLVAQGLGFERCRSVCLQGSEAVLQVSDAGPRTITGVSGPVQQLSNVLRSRGLK